MSTSGTGDEKDTDSSHASGGMQFVTPFTISASGLRYIFNLGKLGTWVMTLKPSASAQPVVLRVLLDSSRGKVHLLARGTSGQSLRFDISEFVLAGKLFRMTSMEPKVKSSNGEHPSGSN